MMLTETVSDDNFEKYMQELFSAIVPGSRFILGVADTVPPDASFARLAAGSGNGAAAGSASVGEKAGLPAEISIPAETKRPAGSRPRRKPAVKRLETRSHSARSAGNERPGVLTAIIPKPPRPGSVRPG